MTLSKERLHQALWYNSKTGIFRRREAWPNNVKIGSIAGRITTNGRCQIGIDGRKYSAAKLAWFYVTGEWPQKEIDHKNCKPLDNRFSNLREATHQQNMGNVRRLPNNTSGIKGVCWHKGSKRWHARITQNGKPRFLGQFTSKTAAAIAYAVAAKETFGDFARLR